MKESVDWPALPPTWDLVKLGHAVEIPTGLVDPTDGKYAELRLIAPNHVESHTSRLLGSESADDQGASSGKFLVENGEIVYSKIRPALNKVVIAPERCLCSADMYPLRPKAGLLESKFLLYTMLSGPFLQRTIDESMRVAMPKVNRESLKQILVPIPPCSTQRAIASFLDRETEKIDTLIEKKRRLLDLLEEKRTALITRAVTRGLDPDVPMKDSGVGWLGEIPEHWEVRQSRYLCCKSRPIIYGIVLPGPDAPNGVPIIKGGDVERNDLDPGVLNRTAVDIEARHKRSRVSAGDVIYSIRGSFGRAAIVPPAADGANMTQDVARISPRKGIDKVWLAHVITSPPIRAVAEAGAVGATIKGVNIRDLRRLPIPTPPRVEQKALRRFLTRETGRIDRIKERTGEAISLLKEYRTALISAAVIGKIDVRDKILA